MLELALTELVPTRTVLNLAGYVILGIPVDWGTTAIEGRARAGKAGPAIAKFKDREHGQAALVSVADVFWYAHAKHTMDAWAEKRQFAMKAERMVCSTPWRVLTVPRPRD